jgi:hypothetical protein
MEAQVISKLSSIQLECIKLLLETDNEVVLQHLKTVLLSWKDVKEKDIIGFRPEGEPITKKQFLKDIEKAEEDFRLGFTISQEDLEKESKNW